MKNANSVAQAPVEFVKASALSSADATRLTELIQSTKADDTDTEESHSGRSVGTLNDLFDKARAQLNDALKTETADLHNFHMLSA